MLDVVQPVLEQNEVVQSLMLGVLLGLARAEPAVSPAQLLATVHRRGSQGWSLAALMKSPHPLLLAAADRASVGDFAALAEYLADAGIEVSELSAVSAVAETFAGQWSELMGLTATIRWKQRLHALTEVEVRASAPGQLRLAAADDLDLIAQWFAAFEAEALDKHDVVRAAERAADRVRGRQMYLWEDTEPRAMAGWGRPTANTVSVNAVYTPPQWRGRGYATAIVAELSRQLLSDEYRTCVLFTDTSNFTSNDIYRQIGYRPVADFVHVRFS